MLFAKKYIYIPLDPAPAGNIYRAFRPFFILLSQTKSEAKLTVQITTAAYRICALSSDPNRPNFAPPSNKYYHTWYKAFMPE